MNSPALRNEIAIDAGPLIALARIDLLDLPSRLFRDAVTTRTVVDECTADPDFIEAGPIKAALANKTIRQTMPPVSTVYTFSNLDPGEISVLQYACIQKCAVLIDDRSARVSAQRLGLRVLGTCGLLVMAQREQLLGPLQPLLLQLKQSGYYLADDLIKQVLALVGED